MGWAGARPQPDGDERPGRPRRLQAEQNLVGAHERHPPGACPAQYRGERQPVGVCLPGQGGGRVRRGTPPTLGRGQQVVEVLAAGECGRGQPARRLVHGEPGGQSGPFVTVGLRPGATVAVLANDPLAIAPRPEIKVVDDEAALLSALRAGLLDAHLNPLLDRVRGRVRLGARTLMGSLASGIAHALLRAADALPGSAVEAVDTVLGALDLADLVELMPDQAGRPTVQRKTCCLAFTLPKPRVCAGCCIRPTP
ncbi:MAG TPA: hypothetical protein VNV66_10680 [Pilimelia sp.]|nr:hypothetical protein [Pilimelia sp.]